MINGCSRFMRQVKTCNHTFCLPTKRWLTGGSMSERMMKWQPFFFTSNLKSWGFKRRDCWWCCLNFENSPGMSVRLCCWKQNEGVSGTDPGSSRVYPEETVREDEPNVPCSQIYPTCEDYWSALKLQSPVAGKWSCVCIKARAEAHVITVYLASHHLAQAFSSDSPSAHRLVTVLFCSSLHSMFFSHRDVIPSIIFFSLLTELLCHNFDKLQFPPRGASESSICAWDQTHSLCTLRFSH